MWQMGESCQVRVGLIGLQVKIVSGKKMSYFKRVKNEFESIRLRAKSSSPVFLHEFFFLRKQYIFAI